MKLGILGTGKIVREFLPWLAEHTPFTVQAICSTERSAGAKSEQKFGNRGHVSCAGRVSVTG